MEQVGSRPNEYVEFRRNGYLFDDGPRLMALVGALFGVITGLLTLVFYSVDLHHHITEFPDEKSYKMIGFAAASIAVTYTIVSFILVYTFGFFNKNIFCLEYLWLTTSVMQTSFLLSYLLFSYYRGQHWEGPHHYQYIVCVASLVLEGLAIMAIWIHSHKTFQRPASHVGYERI